MWSSRRVSSRRKAQSEARIAREQLRQMVHYAEARECRRTTLLRYFGEERPDESCNGCDNCLTPRETFDGTIAAQKFLSCVHRVRAKSGFSFGLNHIVEVLTGRGHGGGAVARAQRGLDLRHRERFETRRLAIDRARTAAARAGGSGARANSPRWN